MSESNATINSSVDVDAHAESVQRAVEYGDGDLRVATISQVYPTTAEDLWEACTVADRLARWFAPVTGDLRLGGKYAVQGNASGTVESCDPPKSYGITWEFGGDVSWVTVTVSPEDDGARFTLEHRAHVDDERWDEYGPGAVGVGWDLALLGLANHLADPSAAAIDAEAWGATEEARGFIAAASAGWARANIAAGTPAEAAEAARDRVTGFYTGG